MVGSTGVVDSGERVCGPESSTASLVAVQELTAGLEHTEDLVGVGIEGLLDRSDYDVKETAATDANGCLPPLAVRA